jgi:hypothetical protein
VANCRDDASAEAGRRLFLESRDDHTSVLEAWRRIRFDQPQVGDALGYGKNRMRFERVEPRRVLATRSEDGNWVWSFVLDEHDGKTRLISRNRFRLPSLTANTPVGLSARVVRLLASSSVR